jgi:hypothetical protein
MRLAPLAAALALAACACGWAAAGCADNGDTFGDCASRETWNGREYTTNVPGPRRDLPPTGAKLTPDAVRLTCERETLTARRIVGVDPALAIRAGDDDPWLWLARDFYPELPTHPLHRALYGAADKPFRAGDFRRCSFRGTIYATGEPYLEVRRGSSFGRVVIDAGTTVTGAPTVVAGQPRMDTGAKVVITGRRCAPIHDPGLPEGDWQKLTAVRIRFA